MKSQLFVESREFEVQLLVEIQPFCSPSKEPIDEPEVKSCVSREP